MRAKKAKRLRQQAAAATVGAPDRELIAHVRNQTTWFHHPGTTRATYQNMKRGVLPQPKE